MPNQARSLSSIARARDTVRDYFFDIEGIRSGNFPVVIDVAHRQSDLLQLRNTLHRELPRYLRDSLKLKVSRSSSGFQLMIVPLK